MRFIAWKIEDLTFEMLPSHLRFVVPVHEFGGSTANTVSTRHIANLYNHPITVIHHVSELHVLNKMTPRAQRDDRIFVTWQYGCQYCPIGPVKKRRYKSAHRADYLYRVEYRSCLVNFVVHYKEKLTMQV